MPDTKISALTQLTTSVDDDELVVVDKSDTTMAASGTTKRITKQDLLAAFQPLDSDLTAIAALSTTAYGRAFLALADAAAARTAISAASVAALAALQAEVDSVESALGATLGESDATGSTINLDYTTHWGVDGSGNAYYEADPADVTPGEEAVLVVGPFGQLAVVKPTTDTDDELTPVSLDVLTAAVAAEAELRTAADKVVVGNRRTADYTLALTDAGKRVETNHATNAIVVTVPTNATVPFPVDSVIEVLRYGAGAATIAAAGGVTIRSEGGLLSIGAQYTSASLTKLATNEWLLVGNLA